MLHVNKNEKYSLVVGLFFFFSFQKQSHISVKVNVTRISMGISVSLGKLELANVNNYSPSSHCCPHHLVRKRRALFRKESVVMGVLWIKTRMG